MLVLLALLACGSTTEPTDTGSVDTDDCEEECPEEDQQTFYLDADGDGYGDDDNPVVACTQPDFAVTQGGDCDDLDASVSPDASEICNELDDDCDGDIDEEASDASTWYADTDGDGFGDATSSIEACPGEDGWVEDGTDCDDTDAAIYPGADSAESPDDPDGGVDGNCDGEIVCEDGNCDGLLDLVINGEAYYDEDCGADLVYYGDGGDYSELSPSTLDNGCTRAHAIADLDQDGYADLVSVIRGDGTEPMDGLSVIYWGTGSGWTSANSTELETVGAVGVLIEDLDGDGWEDLSFTEASAQGYDDFDQSSTIYWNSSGSFTTSTDLSTHGAWDTAAADLNGDGYTDLVVCNSAADSGGSHTLEIDSFIFWGSASGYSDSDREGLPTLSCRGVAIADLDQDGMDDLIFANSHSNSSSTVDSVIYWNSSSGFDASDSTELLTSWTYDVVVGDFNGDGWDDLGFSSGFTDDYSDGIFWEHPTYVYWNSSGAFDPSDLTELEGDVSYGVEAADLDKDGMDELIVPAVFSSDGTETTSRVYWGGEEGFTHSDELPTFGPAGVTVGDLDADGYPELLFAATTSTELAAQIFWGSSYGYHPEDLTEVGDSPSFAAPLIVGDSSW